MLLSLDKIFRDFQFIIGFLLAHVIFASYVGGKLDLESPLRLLYPASKCFPQSSRFFLLVSIRRVYIIGVRVGDSFLSYTGSPPAADELHILLHRPLK